MDISIIIPSLRPLVLLKTIQRIYATTHGLDYEIIVISPLDMPEIGILDRVKIVKEEESKGSNYAIELGVKQASGEYIMELSDDNLVDTDCFYNIVQYMKKRDKELFLCGPRVHDLWEVHPENTVYGFYYPKTPCIRKDNLSKIGFFYDTQFHSYFGDPDLALRVISKGGTVGCCLDAWLEFNNIKYDTVVDGRKIHFDADSHTFLDRWKILYGRRVSNPDKPEIVNLGGIRMFLDGTSPYEYCSRIFQALKTEQWTLVDFELSNRFICSLYLLPDLLAYILAYEQFIPEVLYKKLIQTLQEKNLKSNLDINIKDAIYMLCEINDNKKVQRLFNDIKKYRKMSKEYITKKVLEADQLIKSWRNNE